MGDQNSFRISTALKDVIGRDLITNDYVAIFELVKNSFDAHATNVTLYFGDDEIVIADDGKGMSRDDIISKWLFVAYSAKAEGTEDDRLSADYRNSISHGRGFAGNKGIGRFSCDRLGASLSMYTRAASQKTLNKLSVDWTDFEIDPKEEMDTIPVELGTSKDFPKLPKLKLDDRSGTVLVIRDLRRDWNPDRVDTLRSYLAKLVDPFGVTRDMKIRLIRLKSYKLGEFEEGLVGNNISDVLEQKTTKIDVVIEGGSIRSSLTDRGLPIFKIEEESPFAELEGTRIEGSVFYLNRSAKATFTRRMGVQPVKFGNLFLFVNGFRVFPIGEPTDDTFGILRRKQQGTSRYLGLRDIMGRVSVDSPPKTFKEASARDAGLVMTERVQELYEAIRSYMVFRLERYVVGVTWKDKLDADREDSSGLTSDAARSRIIDVVQKIVGSKEVTLLSYNEDLLDIVSEEAAQFESALDSLEAIAIKNKNEALLGRIRESRSRFAAQQAAEAEAIEAAKKERTARLEAEKSARESEKKATVATRKAQVLERQNKYLERRVEAENSEVDLLHHQAIIHGNEIATYVEGASITLGDLRDQASGGRLSKQELIDTILQDSNRIRQDLAGISLQNQRVGEAMKLALHGKFMLDGNKIEGDLATYLQEYLSEVARTRYSGLNIQFENDDVSTSTSFRPIDIAVIAQNLLSNAKIARATWIKFEARKARFTNAMEIAVIDNGRGIDDQQIDSSRIFDIGYTSREDGTGLGLYHVKTVIENMGGSVALSPDQPESGAAFILQFPRGKR